MNKWTRTVAIAVAATALCACAGKKTSFDRWVDDSGRNRPWDMAIDDERICGLENSRLTTRQLQECMTMKGWSPRPQASAIKLD